MNTRSGDDGVPDGGRAPDGLDHRLIHFSGQADDSAAPGAAQSYPMRFREEAAIAIRIQVGPMPTMLGEIVSQMLGDHDTIIVGRSAPDAEPLADARAARANLLVVRSQPGKEGAIEQIFAAPDLSILMISDDGRDGRLVGLVQVPVALDRSSIGALLLRLAENA